MTQEIKVRVVRAPKNPMYTSTSFYSVYIKSVPELVYMPLEKEMNSIGTDPVSLIELQLGDFEI